MSSCKRRVYPRLKSTQRHSRLNCALTWNRIGVVSKDPQQGNRLKTIDERPHENTRSLALNPNERVHRRKIWEWDENRERETHASRQRENWFLGTVHPIGRAWRAGVGGGGALEWTATRGAEKRYQGASKQIWATLGWNLFVRRSRVYSGRRLSYWCSPRLSCVLLSSLCARACKPISALYHLSRLLIFTRCRGSCAARAYFLARACVYSFEIICVHGRLVEFCARDLRECVGCLLFIGCVITSWKLIYLNLLYWFIGQR